MPFYMVRSQKNLLNSLTQALDLEREAVPPYNIALPFYVCRHGGDSELIREKYIRARAKLGDLFLGKTYKQAVKDEASKKSL